MGKHTKRYDQGEHYEALGNDYWALFPADTTAASHCVAARIRPGFETVRKPHDDCEEYFIVLEGKGEIFIDGEVTAVGPGSVAMAPPHALHSAKNMGTTDLVYLFIEVFPGGVPEKMRDWRQVVADFEKKYAVG